MRSLAGHHMFPAGLSGTILATPGYDDVSGFLLLPTIDVPPVHAHRRCAAASALVAISARRHQRRQPCKH
jgi:hypothetical protein